MSAPDPFDGRLPMVAGPWLARREARRAALVVDMRSPSEFAADHVPGAVNVPLFDDLERGIVGLLYKQFSPEAAFGEGRAIVAERIEGLVGRIAELAGWSEEEHGSLRERVLAMTAGGIEEMARSLERVEVIDPAEGPRLDGAPRPVVVHCWRGGMRSRSVVALLRTLGHHEVVGLADGYRAWRRLVQAGIEEVSVPPTFVLRGLTGVGKSLVLREIERQRPGSTLDLEALAEHRGSLLGMVGLTPCTQKTFETRLHERIQAGFGAALVFEGESRRVGDCTIPPSIWNAMSTGTSLCLTASTPRRVQVLMDDYLADPEARPELRRQLAEVEARMAADPGQATEGEVPSLTGLLDEGREPELVEVLLEHYYDPLYRHSERKYLYAETFAADDPARCAAEVLAWIDGHPFG